MVMRNRQDVNLVVCDQEGQVIGKAHRRSPTVAAFRLSLESRPGCVP
jgi:hypothetical protein